MKKNEESDIDSEGLKQAREKFLILLAEDNQVNIKMILVLLQEAGFRIQSVVNGEQAVSFLSNGKADLVLMDVHMPTMDGFKATREIRALSSPVNRIPIIAITAHAISGDKEKCIEAGMSDYISKPFKPQELIKKLDKWLGIGSDITVEQGATVNDITILDYNNLEQISLGNKEFLQDLLLTYIEDTEVRLKNLSDSFRDKDAKKIILESHSIKGASLSIGANKVGIEAAAIEKSGKSGDLDAAEGKYNDLVDAFKEAKKHILDYLE